MKSVTMLMMTIALALGATNAGAAGRVKVRGAHENGVAVFRGVPYATAPRFVPPRFAVVFLAVLFFAPRVPRPAPRFLAAMAYLPPRGPGAGAAAAGAGVVGVPAAGVGVFLSAALPAAVWPRNSRVGANSPSLWPTMFSVT